MWLREVWCRLAKMVLRPSWCALVWTGTTRDAFGSRGL